MLVRFEMPDGTIRDIDMPAPIRQEEDVLFSGCPSYGAYTITWLVDGLSEISQYVKLVIWKDRNGAELSKPLLKLGDPATYERT